MTGGRWSACSLRWAALFCAEAGYRRRVAIVKVLGVETEYGIILRGGGEPNPIAASSALINAYVASLARRIEWDFQDESPARDARGFVREPQVAPEVETHLVNAVLTNGARYYVDHAHPEYSGPECSTVWEAVLYDKAGEAILARSVEAASRMLPAGQQISVYKNNSDGKGNSYGSHENYLMDRAVPFSRVVQYAIPHFVTRQVYTGAGKVGVEVSGTEHVDFQLTQRADFFEEEVGLETTLKRPIVNTRDEPHCDAQKYRRLHVILGDANLSEVANFVKIGATAARAVHDRRRLVCSPRARLHPGHPGAGHAPGLVRPQPVAAPGAGQWAPDERPGDPVGAPRAGPQVLRGRRPRIGRWRGRGQGNPAPLGRSALGPRIRPHEPGQ